MSPAPAIDEAAVRQHVATRVKELGGTVAADDITIIALDGEAAPGTTAFVAAYEGRAGRSTMTGIVDENGPNTFPLEAIGRLFDKWLVTGLPAPERAAEVITFIQSGGDRQSVVKTDADVASLSNTAARDVVHPPAAIDVKGKPGVEFWLNTRTGLVRRRVSSKAGGGAAVEDRTINDVLKGK
jgi:hypothetical protein